MPSPFKLNPTTGKGELQKRSTLWKVDSKTTKGWQASVKNPAYCHIGSYPDKNFTNYNAVYGSFKLKPILKSVTLTMGGNYGLTMTLEGEIQTFTRGDFESVERQYCRFGKKLNISFGYAKPADPAYSSEKSIGGFLVCKYSFSTNDDGSWTSKFTAVAPGEAIQSADITMACTNLSGMSFILKDSETATVTGLAEMMQYHAQGNGKTATKSQTDGYVNDCKVGGLWLGHCAVFDLREMLVAEGTGNRIFSWVSGVFGKEDDNHCYYTLEYCVNMWNKVVLASYPDMAGSTIDFTDYSYSYINKFIAPARPTEVLMLGNKLGNYKNSSGQGKDFETVIQSKSPFCVKTSGDRNEINHRWILIERGVILAALNAAKPEKKSAESNDVKEKQETNVTVKQYFNTIFDAIDRATGGAMKLRLAMSPNVFEGSKLNAMTIIDENNGRLDAALDCIVFDPIDGDGSTRSCSLTSDAGSQTFQAAMFAGTHKSGDTCAKIADKDPQFERLKAYTQALTSRGQLLWSPGKMQKSGFSEETMKALEEANSSMAAHGGQENVNEKSKYDQLVYPGLGIDVTIDGVWGIRPGCGISTTQLPDAYSTDKGIYFYVDSVVHQFDGESSDWTTKLTGKLNTHHNLAAIRL